MNTQVTYLYRDAANYKSSRVVVLEGELTRKEQLQVLTARHEGLWFIPSQVGLDDLQAQLTSFPDPDDHVWHELLEVTSVAVAADLELPTAQEFLQQMLAAKDKWKVKETAEKYGIK